MKLGLGLGLNRSIASPVITPVDITYTDYATAGTTFATSRTFSAMNIGVADSARIVAVAVGWDRAGTGFIDLTSVTIGGVTATKAGSTYANTDKAIAIFYASIPTGTAADVVVNGSTWACSVSVYRVINASTTTFATAGTNSATDTVSTTINVPNKGGVIGSAYTTGSGISTSNYAWTGVIEDHDSEGANNARRQSSGHIDDATAETGRTITAECVGSSSNDHALAVVSFSPL